MTSVPTDQVWRPLFDAYDYHKTGTISVANFRRILQSNPLSGSLASDNVIICQSFGCCGLEAPFGIAVMHGLLWNTIAENDGKMLITYEQFLVMINDLEKAHQVPWYCLYLVDHTAKALLPKSHRQPFIREHLTDSVPLYQKTPFTLTITALEVLVFLYYFTIHWTDFKASLTSSPFTFLGCSHQQVWRFVTPVLMHASLFHLIMNMLGQLYFGVPLELLYGWWRVAVIYLIGAIGGSLLSSVTGTEGGVGASGSVFALFGAYFANLFNIWSSIPESRIRRLTIFTISLITQNISILFLDVLFDLQIGHMCHLGGFLTGLLIGPTVLCDSLPINGISIGDSISLSDKQKRIRLVALVAFFAFVVVTVTVNVVTFDGGDSCEKGGGGGNDTRIET